MPLGWQSRCQRENRRVRIPCAPPKMGPSFNGRTSALQAENQGSIPWGSTNSSASASGQARRLSSAEREFESLCAHQCAGPLEGARSHKPGNASPILVPAPNSVPGSSNGRAAVLQTADEGSIPSPGTSSSLSPSATAIESSLLCGKCYGSTRGCGPRRRVRLPPAPHFRRCRVMVAPVPWEHVRAGSTPVISTIFGP